MLSNTIVGHSAALNSGQRLQAERFTRREYDSPLLPSPAAPAAGWRELRIGPGLGPRLRQAANLGDVVDRTGEPVFPHSRRT